MSIFLGGTIMHLLLILSLFYTIPLFATSTTLDCSHFFPDGETEQGGGHYFIRVNAEKLTLWHQPYQGQYDGSDNVRSAIPISHLKKIMTPTSYIKLYTGSSEGMMFEYVSIGEMGVLDVQMGKWSRTYKCE
jgi:hypothetical protein